jgi:hypothetical protein
MVAMAEAFKILGYPTFHGRDLYFKIGEGRMWEDALQAKFFPSKLNTKPFGRAEFDQLLGPYAAVADSPAVCFGPELIQAYPEAKVVLVERDIESWYDSFYDVLIAHAFHPLASFGAFLEPEIAGPIVRNLHTIAGAYFRANTRQEYAANARAVYREHYRMIREVTPKERLLEFDLKQGWAPLCEFLGRPIPDVPFPKTNEREMNTELKKLILARTTSKLLRNIVVLLSAAGLLLLYSYTNELASYVELLYYI